MSLFLKICLPIFIILLALNIMGVGWMFSDGTSMEPTSYTGDIIVFMNPWFLHDGDEVVFEASLENWPKNERLWHKRINHTKGDGYWMLGDNAETSFDSRYIGYVNKNLVWKKVLFVIHTNHAKTT